MIFNNFFPGTNIPAADFSLPQNVADKIGKLIMDKFTEVIVGQATQHSRRKVLAGIGKVYTYLLLMIS